MPGDAPGRIGEDRGQQGSPTPLVPVQHFDADQRQVPMRFGWPVMLGHLEDAADLGLLLAGNAFCKNRFERTIVTTYPGGSQSATPWPSLVYCAAPASNELVPRARNSRGMCGMA